MKQLLITGFLLFTVEAGLQAQPDLSGYQRTDGGIYYRVERQGKGAMPKVYDWVKIHLVNRNQDGQVIFSTYSGGGSPVSFQLQAPGFNGDLVEVLPLLHEGDSVTLAIASDSVYRDGVMPDFTRSGEFIFYDLVLVDVETPLEHEQAQQKQKQQMHAKQVAEIEQKLKDEGVSYQQTPEGMFYVVEQEGNGPLPKDGETVKVHYTGWLMNGQKFDSSVDRGQPFSFMLGTGRVIKGWELALRLMKKGEKIMVYLPSDLAYGERGAGEVIPPNAILVFEIELLDITNRDKVIQQDMKTIEAYLKEKGLEAQPSPYGLYYHIDRPGTGPNARPGDLVTVNYTGMLLDGKVFDSSYSRDAPITFTLGRGQVIEGWEKGLLFFNKGAKGTIYLPSPLAYGDSGAGALIPPNAILIFDIEVVDIQNQ